MPVLANVGVLVLCRGELGPWSCCCQWSRLSYFVQKWRVHMFLLVSIEPIAWVGGTHLHTSVTCYGPPKHSAGTSCSCCRQWLGLSESSSTIMDRIHVGEHWANSLSAWDSSPRCKCCGFPFLHQANQFALMTIDSVHIGEHQANNNFSGWNSSPSW